jgi:hypothetical protein
VPPSTATNIVSTFPFARPSAARDSGSSTIRDSLLVPYPDDPLTLVGDGFQPEEELNFFFRSANGPVEKF